MRDNRDEVFDLFDDDGFDFEEDIVYVDEEVDEIDTVEDEYEDEYDEDDEYEDADEYDDEYDEDEYEEDDVDEEDDELFSRKSTKKSDGGKKKGGSKKGILIALVAVLAIVLIALAVIFLGKGDEGGSDKTSGGAGESQGVSTEATTTEEETTTAPVTLPAETKPEVKVLMEKYYAAVKAADLAALSNVIDSTANISLQKMEKRAEYIEDYQNMVCYTVDGMDAGTYLVFVSFDMKFVNIQTPAPALDYYYLKTKEDGSLYVCTSFTDEEKAFIETKSQEEEVVNLAQIVNDRFEVALTSDAKLNNFVQLLKGGEDVTAAPPDDTTAEETTADGTAEETTPEETTAAQRYDTAVVRDGGGTLRSSAKIESGEGSNVICRLEGGEKAKVLNSTNDGSYEWYFVEIVVDGDTKEGYVREDCLEFN